MKESSKSFIKSLFRGDILNDILFPYPNITTEEEEQVRMKMDSIETAFSTNLANPLTETDIEYAGKMGLTALLIPTMYKGFGFNYKMYVRLMEELYSIKPELGITVGMYHNPCVYIINKYATEEIKSKFLNRMINGEVASYALYEGEEHEDIHPKEIGKTIAERPTDDNYYTINGEKFIVNGSFSKIFLIFAITNDGLTCFLVDDSIGLKTPEKLESNTNTDYINHFRIKLDGIKVPKENRIGEEGQGYDIAMELLNITRLNYAIISMMLAKKALKETIIHKDHSNKKSDTEKVNGVTTLKDFKTKMVKIASKLYEIESTVDIVAGILDEELDVSLEAPLLKVIADENLSNIIKMYDLMFNKEEAFPFRILADDMISGRTFTVDNRYLLRYITSEALKEKQTEVKKFKNDFTETNKKILDGFKQFGDFANKTFSKITDSFGVLTGEGNQVEKSQKIMNNFNEFKKDFNKINKTIANNSKDFINITVEGVKGLKEEMLDFLPNDLIGMTSIKSVKQALGNSKILFNLYINALRQESRRLVNNYDRIETIDKEKKDNLSKIVTSLFILAAVISRTDYILGKADIVMKAEQEIYDNQNISYNIIDKMPKEFYINIMSFITKNLQKQGKYIISFDNDNIDSLIDKLYSYLSKIK